MRRSMTDKMLRSKVSKITPPWSFSAASGSHLSAPPSEATLHHLQRRTRPKMLHPMLQQLLHPWNRSPRRAASAWEEPAFIEVWRPAGRAERRPHKPRRPRRPERVPPPPRPRLPSLKPRLPRSTPPLPPNRQSRPKIRRSGPHPRPRARDRAFRQERRERKEQAESRDQRVDAHGPARQRRALRPARQGRSGRSRRTRTILRASRRPTLRPQQAAGSELAFRQARRPQAAARAERERAELAPKALQRQRIDKWLWHARMVRTRTDAAKLTEAGFVRLNGVRVAGAERTWCASAMW